MKAAPGAGAPTPGGYVAPGYGAPVYPAAVQYAGFWRRFAAILIDGPGGFKSSLFDMKAQTARQTFETNVLGPLHLTQAVVPIMQRQGAGRIMNAASFAAIIPSIGSAAYAASKSAVVQFTRTAALELAQSVSCAPGKRSLSQGRHWARTARSHVWKRNWPRGRRSTWSSSAANACGRSATRVQSWAASTSGAEP